MLSFVMPYRILGSAIMRCLLYRISFEFVLMMCRDFWQRLQLVRTDELLMPLWRLWT